MLPRTSSGGLGFVPRSDRLGKKRRASIRDVMHLTRLFLWWACLIILCADPCAAQGTDFPCGKTNGTNSTTTFTDPESFADTLEDDADFTCLTWTGNIAILPTINYNLALWETIEDDLQAIDGSLLINCTGVSTDGGPTSPDNEGTLDAFGSLENTTGSFTIVGCSTFHTLQLYSLTTVGGNVNIYGNPQLAIFILYVLENVTGSLNLHQEAPDPGDRASIDLSNLRTVGGNINITGPLVSLTSSAQDTTVPQDLTSVEGSVYINSTGQFDCCPWQQLSASGVIKGNLSCVSALSNNCNGTSLSPGAIAGIAIGCLAVIALVIAVLCFRKRSRGRSRTHAFHFLQGPTDRNRFQVSEARAERGLSTADAPPAYSPQPTNRDMLELATESSVPELPGEDAPAAREPRCL